MTRAALPILSLIVTVALAVAGCGGGDDDSSTSTTAAAAVTPGAAKECLKQAGIDVTTEQPVGKDVVATFYINVDTYHQVYVAFTKSPEAAARVEETVAAFAEIAGGNARAELVGEDIVLGTARDTTGADVNPVKSCLTN